MLLTLGFGSSYLLTLGLHSLEITLNDGSRILVAAAVNRTLKIAAVDRTLRANAVDRTLTMTVVDRTLKLSDPG